jgi:hypothetical protein
MKSATQPAKDLTSGTRSFQSDGGRRAIAGFLFQILRSLQLGMSLSAKFQADGPGYGMQLTLEPEEAGDIRIQLGTKSIIEQVKIRTKKRRWSPAEVAREVLPDLLRGAHPGWDQAFRFATDNPAGLDALRDFLAYRHEGLASEGRFRWGQAKLTAEVFAARLAGEAQIQAADPRWTWLLDRLSLVVVDPATADNDIEAAIAPMLDPGHRAADKRHELVARLLDAATRGETLDAGRLFGLIGPDALRRLQHAQGLPGQLARMLPRDCTLLGYEEDHEARSSSLNPTSDFTILSGESGQGKTWSLCRAALTQAARAEAVIVLSAASDFLAIERSINERVWLPAFAEPASLALIGRRLWSQTNGASYRWLTLYLDDLQDPRLADAIARFDWAGHGIRVVVSAQPRITRRLTQLRPDADVVEIGDFSSKELRLYLRSHGREAPLETMPDDVFELLTKPIHARMFVALPAQDRWTGQTEYALFEAYWDFATGQARDQYDYPRDRDRLSALAGALLGERPVYPWRSSELREADFGDDAVIRLEQVGMIRRPRPDQVAFAVDRMLNWAVAEHLAQRTVKESWTPVEVEEQFRRLDQITTRDNQPVGRRLGYVFLDMVWLLVREMQSTFVADLLVEHMSREPHEWRSERAWTHLATVGPNLLPALELLARRPLGHESEWIIPLHLSVAILAAGESEPELVHAIANRLLALDEDKVVRVALKLLHLAPGPTSIDPVWTLHQERARALDAYRESPSDAQRHGVVTRRYEESFDALKSVVATNTDWLDRTIGETRDTVALDQLLWVLINNGGIDDATAEGIWSRRLEHVITTLPRDSMAFIAALGHFRAEEHRNELAAVALTRDDWMAARVLRTRAQIDPEAAFLQIRERHQDYGWSTADWWLPQLARADPIELSDAVREYARRGDDPLTDLVLYYRSYPELMDSVTLDWVLDLFEIALRQFNDAHNGDPEAQPGRLGHGPRFLSSLPEPWQWAQLAKRAGTPLETELVRYAVGRRGRTSRVRDIDGSECERLLAMFNGTGFSALVTAELTRADPFGREDGYSAARWTESECVTAALHALDEPPITDSYRRVIRMQALAIHQLDYRLEEMVRADAPIYLNAIEMRHGAGRSTDNLQSRVEELVATSDPADLLVATELGAFLSEPNKAETLVHAFLAHDTAEATRRRMVGTFRAIRLYDPRLLPGLRALLVGRIDEDAQFVALYLAEMGDKAGRAAVTDWLEDLNLGSWSSSRHSYLMPLAEHEDSRPTVISFLKRSREQGHLLTYGWELRLLAKSGDPRSHDELVRAAYRGNNGFGAGSVAGIEYLRTVDSGEAFFAATRLLARHSDPGAVDLMLQIDQETALTILIERYRDAKPSLRREIARRIRADLDGTRFASIVTQLAKRKPLIAAELGGYVTPCLSLPWLDQLAEVGPAGVQEAARSALARRSREAAALGHLEAMATSSKPAKWARLQTVFNLVDPFFLWLRDDPASLQSFVEENPPEFLVEARSMRTSRNKELDDEAKRADQKARSA